MSDVGSINLAEQYDFQNRQLGVILALSENPTAVAKIISQLKSASGGSIGEGVNMWYEKAKAEIASIP